MTADFVLHALKKYNMLEKGGTVVVGLSGGADSVCLTHALWSIKDELDLTLVAAHVNHGIRGGEAQRDEDFCKAFCEKYGIEFKVLKADIPALSRQQGLGEEECGRKVRYEFFSSLAGENGKIATAHNLNDNAETLLFNLTRGTALKGAGGIPPVRDNIIRPLILTPREEIERYCADNSLSFITDSTNLKNEYTRNKIRNIIIPQLKEINSDAVSALAGFCEYAREDSGFLESLADEKYASVVNENVIDEAEFSVLPNSLKRRVAARYLSALTDKDVLSKHIEALIQLAGTNSALETVDGIKLKSKDGKIFIQKDNVEPFSVDVKAESGEYSFLYGKAKIAVYDTKDLQNFNKQLLDNSIDCDKIGKVLKLRSRREGDKITLAKRGITKTLKKLFIEDRIPEEKRNSVAVLADGDSVVWVQGYGVSKSFKANAYSNKIMSIIIEEKVSDEHNAK